MKQESIVNSLAEEFWLWRSDQQPRSHDDIPRIERPDHWVPRWSASDVAGYQEKIRYFEERLAKIFTLDAIEQDEDRSAWVDKALLHSAISRVQWELNHLEMWRRQPGFYIDQTIGVVFDYLTPIHVDSRTIDNVRRSLRSFETILQDARLNLSEYAFSELAQQSIEQLSEIEAQLQILSDSLLDHVDQGERESFRQECSSAGLHLSQFRKWLLEEMSHFPKFMAIGESGFNWFLKNVALLPYSVSELTFIGEREFERSIFLETVSQNRNVDLPLPPLPKSAQVQSEDESRLEQEVRDFYESQNLLTQPSTLGRYLNAPRPEYLEALRWLGVTDDLTGPSRLDTDGVSYVPKPDPQMPYFYAANARDPRAGIAHEGAHYKQLALSWRNERPIRRHYYDSCANEGIAFYNEELLLAAGLFDDKPHSRTLMYNFMRLRALRVIIDVSLATGQMDIETATQYLVEKVPVDAETAREEAVFFAGFPGQGLTYQIGKTQIIKLLADTTIAKGREYSLREFHDYLWSNGNLPISLLRYELLGDNQDIQKVLGLGDARDVEEIWGNVRTMLDAYMAKDRSLADSFISEEVTLWDSEERDLIHTLVGLNQLRDRRPTAGDGPEILGIDNIKPMITIHGDLAIARYELHVRTPEGIHDEHIRNTAVWRRENGKWLCIHNHEDKLNL